MLSGELMPLLKLEWRPEKGIHLNCTKTSGRVDLEFVLTLFLAVRLVARMRGVRIVVGKLRLEKLSWGANNEGIYWKFHMSRGKLEEVQIKVGSESVTSPL